MTARPRTNCWPSFLSNTIAAAIPQTDRQEAVTRLLSAWQSGDALALERLTPLIYEELRDRARRYMKNERAGHTLQATAVVHEAFVKLVEMNISWQDRAHFFAVAARQMRRILVDHARRQLRGKRGGGVSNLALDEAVVISPEKSGDILSLNEALDRLTKIDPFKARIVELRHFGGLSVEETAEVLKISEVTVMRHWSLAKAWLRREVRG